MAFGRNIPQEQEMLKQLPDELLESGLDSKPGDSPFTQFLGAIEMTKRVQQRKSAANTLAGQEVQPGTVVGRMMAKRSEIGPPQAAPNFSHGGPVKGEIPPQFQPGYQAQGAPQGGNISPGPTPATRRSVTKQHQSTGGGGGNVTQMQLAYNRSPQKLATGGLVQPQPRQSFGIGGVVQSTLNTPEDIQNGMTPQQVMENKLRAAQGEAPGQRLGFADGGRVPQIRPSYAHGTTGVMSPLEAENARRAALGMPPIPSTDTLPLTRAENSQDALLGSIERKPVAVPGNEGLDMSQFSNPQLRQIDRTRAARQADPNARVPQLPGEQRILNMDDIRGIRPPGPPPWAQQQGPAQPPAAPVTPAPEDDINAIKAKMTQEKTVLDLDAATAEEHGETDIQRSERFRRAAALGAMAASFGSNPTFLGGFTEGAEKASAIMQAGDTEARDRLDSQAYASNKQASASQALDIRVQSLKNDLANNVVGTRIKMVKAAQDAVQHDVEMGVSNPSTPEDMARLVESKMTTLFGSQQKPAPSVGSTVLGTKE
jgi:hypothetical protein